MNRYKLVCLYCDESWEINYVPKEALYCSKCRSTDVKAIDLASTKIDHYAGSPPFESDLDKWNR